jgi:EAL domain-containing protein (putative c-di-GMP-specific phosphodiesterase class I)
MTQIESIIQEEIDSFNNILDKVNEVYKSISSVSSVPLSILKLMHSSVHNLQNSKYEEALDDLSQITSLITTFNESIQNSIQTLNKES